MYIISLAPENMKAILQGNSYTITILSPVCHFPSHPIAAQEYQNTLENPLGSYTYMSHLLSDLSRAPMSMHH